MRDKMTQRMTKDGLVEVNQATGEQHRISLRGQELQLRQGKTATEPAPIRKPMPARRSRRQVHLGEFQPKNSTNTDQRLDDPTSATNYTKPPSTSFSDQLLAESLPQKARPHRIMGSKIQENDICLDTPNTEPYFAESESPAKPLRADNLPCIANFPLDHAPQDAPLPDTSESAPFLPEPPGRLRFESGCGPKLQDKHRQRNSKYACKFTQDVESALQKTTTNGGGSDIHTIIYNEKTPVHEGSTAPISDFGTAPTPSKKSSRLQFDVGELPPKTALERQIERQQTKIGKTDAKLEKAQDHLPTKEKKRNERILSTEKGKPQRKIYFEQEVKSQRAHLKGTLPTRSVKAWVGAAAGFAHGKVRQAEQGNAELEAVHMGEIIAENIARYAYRQHKTAPYRRVKRLSNVATKQSTKLTYQEALQDNPKLQSNAVSRFVQKRKIKRQYAKAARDTKRTAHAAKKTGTAAVEGTKIAAVFARQHPATFGVVGLILLLMLVIMSMLGSCTGMAGSAVAVVLSGSYLAEDGDIDNSELSYTDWETELQMQIDNAEADHPGYNEYRFDLGEIGHDPYEILAYLTAKYQDYTFDEVQGELWEIFDEQYTLEFLEEVEVRYRTGENGRQEAYEWRILFIKLTVKPLEEILESRMDENQKEVFDTLLASKGNRQYSMSPLGFDWSPLITSSYGWRVHPISGERDFHNAVDIAVPEGTAVLAGHDGKVLTAHLDADGYGWYITLEGKNGISTRYAHCSKLLVSVGQEVKKGETIAKSGNTGNSTGPHLHYEVRMNGQTLNPLFFAITSGEENAE